MTLNSEYQYIGRSAGLRNIGGGYYYYLLLYAKTSGSVVTGKHTVSLKLRLACDLDVYFYGYATSVYGKVAGQSALSWNGQYKPAAEWSKNLTEGGVTYPRWAELGEGAVDVYVGYGAEKTVALEASFQRLDMNDPPMYLPINTALKHSCNVVLPALVGASVPTAAASCNLGSPLTINTNRKSTALTHKLTYSFAGRSGVIAEGVGDSYSWTPPLSLAEAIPTAAAAGATIYCQTYAGGQAVGEAKSLSVQLRVPQTAATKPSVSLSLSPSGLGGDFAGLYIQNLTRVNSVFTAAGKLGAAIASKTLTLGSSPYTGGVLTQQGSVVVTATATDSRGFSSSASQTIQVLPYSRPAVLPYEGKTDVICGRCDASGRYTDSGTYLRILARRSYSALLSGGAQKNFCSLKFRLNGGVWYDLLKESDTADQVDTGPIQGVTLVLPAAYTLEIQAEDSLGNSATVTRRIPTDKVDIHLRHGGGGLAVGGYCTREGFECNLPAWFSANVQAPNLLGRYVTDNSANLTYNAGMACLGSASNMGLVLIIDSADPRRFLLGSYYYVSGAGNTVATIAASGLTCLANIYGTISARDAAGAEVPTARYVAMPCFSI